MIRQISDNGKRSSKNDLILLGILLFLVFFAGAISRFIKAIPAPFNAPAMLMLFAGVAGLCLWIYRKILCSFCYTLVYAPSDPEDLDAFMEKVSELGIPAIGPISPTPDIRFFFIKDPNGVTIQFI